MKSISIKLVMCHVAASFVLLASSSQVNAQGISSVLGGATSPSEANSAPLTAESMGELAPLLTNERDRDWICETDGQDFRLTSNEEGDIKYFWMDTDTQHHGSRSCQVTVDVNEKGMGGLIYGFNEDPKSYFLIVVDSDNTLRIFDRNADGFSERMSSTFDAKGSEVHLEIRENGQNIDVYVNGQNMIGFGNGRMGQGGIGIAAISGGSCLFSDFELQVGKTN